MGEMSQKEQCQSMEGVATCKYKSTNSFWHKIGRTSYKLAVYSTGEYNSLQETH